MFSKGSLVGDFDLVIAFEGFGAVGFEVGVGFGGSGSVDKGVAGIFDVAPSVAGCAFQLVLLSGGLFDGVVEECAGGLFEAAAYLLQFALDVVLVHGRSPYLS